jgi:two-component system NarL family response regulator
MSIRVLLVDDHAMFREALHLVLDRSTGIEVVGELGDGLTIEAEVARLKPDVVVMDVSLPKINGIEVTRKLIASHPKVRVVALSAFCYRQFIMEMMDAGAIAYVVKSAAADKLVDAIKSAFEGKTYLCSESATAIVDANRRAGSSEQPTPRKRLGRRETEVLRLLARGKSSPQIAEELNIASSTVDVHRRNIMEKLDLRGVAELTKYAVRAGLTDI